MEYIIIGHLTLLTLSIHSYLHNCHLNANHNTDNKFVFYSNVLMYISCHFLIYLLASSSHFASHFKYFRESFFPQKYHKSCHILKHIKWVNFIFKPSFINCIFALPFQNTFAKVLKHMNNRTNKVHK